MTSPKTEPESNPSSIPEINLLISEQYKRYESTILALYRWGKQTESLTAYMIYTPQGPRDPYCDHCIDKIIEEVKKSYEPNYQNEIITTQVNWESDSLKWCSRCDKLLDVPLTEEGSFEELEYYKENFLESSNDARIFVQILDSGIVEGHPEQEATVELILQWYQQKILAEAPEQEILREEEAEILTKETPRANRNRNTRRQVSNRRAARGAQTTDKNRR